MLLLSGNQSHDACPGQFVSDVRIIHPSPSLCVSLTPTWRSSTGFDRPAMSRPRLLTTPRTGRQSGRFARPQTSVNTDDIIQALVPTMAAVNQRRPQPRVPASEAPEKCKLEMSLSDFKAWRCSMEWWLNLNRWDPSDAVGHIRLLCTPPLQKAMGA